MCTNIVCYIVLYPDPPWRPNRGISQLGKVSHRGNQATSRGVQRRLDNVSFRSRSLRRGLPSCHGQQSSQDRWSRSRANNNKHHGSKIGGTRPWRHPHHTRSTNYDHNPAWTGTLRGRPTRSHSHPGLRSKTPVTNSTFRTAWPNPRPRGYPRHIRRGLKQTLKRSLYTGQFCNFWQNSFVISIFFESFVIRQTKSCPTGVPGVVHSREM